MGDGTNDPWTGKPASRARPMILTEKDSSGSTNLLTPTSPEEYTQPLDSEGESMPTTTPTGPSAGK